MSYLSLLLIFAPIALAAQLFGWGASWVFAASMLAIVPLAQLMGKATEAIAQRAGPGVGGLLNATFGNATELIIAFFALRAGLYQVVQASITGSLIGNILFVLGLSIFLGGLRYPQQTFNRTIAGLNTGLLVLAVIGLMVPAGFAATSPQLAPGLMERLSLWVALALIGVYVAQLIFSLKTHPDLYGNGEPAHPGEAPHWSSRRALSTLAIATLLVAGLSELLVGAIEPVVKTWGLSPTFIGVILVPIVGNAAEHLTAVTMAIKNKMDLTLAVAIGSTTQIALLVAPVLVLVGFLIGRPLTLAFQPFEVLAVITAVAIANFSTLDGETNWLEGFMLLATYAILAAAFYFHP